ncbi:SWIM zinc finger family protein [Salarchaeum japonicum]|uniref:SWIM-type domain-containing protein n=1 Tax=Salarchaeum japonicum TaxID=555573 RepID=A0AAV3SZZ9_9EURY|nr:SWIM zinc finger family protein [Salarchaeum japonicum]
MKRPLDFERERDHETDSWARSDPLHAVIRPRLGDTYDVKLPNGEYHDVRLHRDHGAWLGTCDCKGYEYNDGPCAHLCALRRAHWTAEHQPSDPAGLDIHGNHVHIPETTDDPNDQPDATPEARADGGCVVEHVERPADLRTEPRWTGR